MHTVGLLGGIASGKSTVAQELARLGAAVLDADQAAHAVLQQPALRQLLEDRWGHSLTLANGQLDRAAIAEQVFDPAAAAELAFLERLLHPPIREEFSQRLRELREEGRQVAVLDAPLLLEAGWQDLCQSLIFVACPLAQRRERALGRGWTTAQFAAREAAQMPITQKRQAADYIIQAGAPLREVSRQIQAVWNDLGGPVDKSS